MFLLSLHRYIIPGAVAIFAYILRVISDWTCAPYATVCKATSEVMHHTSVVVTLFLLIIAATKFKQIKDAALRIKSALEVMSTPPPEGAKKES